MKTSDEMKNVPSFEELVFENRNKEYGAYKIRKKYNMALLWSILVSVFFISASVLTPFVIYKERPIAVITHEEKGPIVLSNDDILLKVEEPKLPKPEPTVQLPKYVPPIVVDTITPDDTKGLLTNEEISKTIKNEPVIEDIVIKPIEDHPVIEDKIEDPYLVSEKPYFGVEGDNEFRRWIAKNVVYPQSVLEAGIQGKVYLEFVIEKDGSITNIKVIRSVDPLLDEEAVRVLSLSPKWNPGKQQGNPVRVRYIFPITFVINSLM